MMRNFKARVLQSLLPEGQFQPWFWEVHQFQSRHFTYESSRLQWCHVPGHSFWSSQLPNRIFSGLHSGVNLRVCAKKKAKLTPSRTVLVRNVRPVAWQHQYVWRCHPRKQPERVLQGEWLSVQVQRWVQLASKQHYQSQGKSAHWLSWKDLARFVHMLLCGLWD